MSRARIVCSKILNRMSPIHHLEDKEYSTYSQDKTFNLCFNECSNTENSDLSDVSTVLSDMNPAIDDWLRQKATSTSMCIDTAYLNDINLLSTRDPDICSLDMGLELVLVNEKKESCTISDKTTDLDYTDHLLNLVPMNEVLLRKTETKCDNLLSGKDLYASDSESNKNRSMWDTINIANRKSDCDTENNGDYADFNLLPLSFETSEPIIEPITENIVKLNASPKTSPEKKDESIVFTVDSPVVNKLLVNDTVVTKIPLSPKNIKLKRPNILRTSKLKTLDLESDIQLKNIDKNMNVDLLTNFNGTEESVPLEFSHSDFVSANDTDFTVLPDDLDDTVTFTVSNEMTPLSSETLIEEEKKIMKRHNISELNNMTGSMAIVTNSVVNSKSRTKIVIKTEKGLEKYEGNTAELMETVGTIRKNRRPGTPVEGEHIVMSVKTAATIKEEKKQNCCKIQQEPEDTLVKEMLSVLGITDDMLYTILTNFGMRMWVCPEHECRRIFNRLNTLKSHILSHYGLKPFKCDFPNCPWSFYTSFKLKRHRETHLKRKDFVCTVPDCNSSFTTVYNLNTHLKLHDRPARLKCLVRTCNFRFQTKRAMEMHLKTHENSQAPYKCPHPGCTKIYFSCNALTTHSRCHQHKEQELRCHWENCGRLFDVPCRLKAHMRQHTGDKPYVCRYKDCKWAFSSSSKLKRHQYKHNNERKFRCTIGDCTKAFMRSEHLRKHTFTHIAQRIFQCTICGEKCSAKATLYVHKKKFHPNENIKTNKKGPVNPPINDPNETKEKQDKENIVKIIENENSAFMSTLTSKETLQETKTITSRPIVVQDLDGKEYEVNLNSESPLEHMITLPSTSSKLKPRKQKMKNNNVVKSCARTYLPYDRVKKIEEQKLNISVKEEPKPSTVSEVQDNVIIPTEIDSVSSDIFLNTDLLGNNQETIYLSNLMLQDDVGTDDIYTQVGAEYILLFDTDTNTTFSESTVNLKDLD